MFKNMGEKLKVPKPEELFNLLIEAVNRVVAPESLVIAKKMKVSEEEKEFGTKVANDLIPGDIILTQTPMSASYEVLRSLAGSYFDHAGVLLDNQTCLQIGPPVSQEMPAYYFLITTRKPLVLRIKPEYRQEFLSNLRRMLGKKYNYGKAVHTWIALFFNEKLRITVRVKEDSSDSVICSDGILSQYPGTSEILKKYSSLLDYCKIGVFSINDFLLLAEKGEFEVVKLPFPFLGLSNSDDTRYLAISRKLLQQESLFSSIVNANNVIQMSKLLASIKKKKYRNVYRLVFAAAQLMKIARIPGLEAFHILSFFWPRL